MSLIPFEQMPYERLEEGELRRQAGEILEKLLRAPDYPAAKDAFIEMQKLSSHFSTLSAIANTRSNIDTTDAFYAQQREYWDHLDPVFEELQQRFTGAMLTHPFRPQFEEMLGKQYFADGELAQRSFSPAIAPLMQEESKLVMAYDQIMAGAQIVFDGKTLTLPQLTPYKQSPHPDIRKAAWCAEGEYLMSHAQQLDDIFHQLVKLRTEMGRKMGYDTFIPLGYDRMKRNCYGAGQVEAFREAVRRHIVPIAAALKRQQAQRLNTSYPMMLSDDSIVFPTGNPLPRGNAQDTLDTARNMYHQLSPETGAFIDVMFEGHLLDVLSKKGKAGGGYCTTLPDYKVPFIFANFNGTAGDVEVMTHEAGHAFAAYMARDIVALEQRWPTLEACEVHSMSMEFFAEARSENFFGADADKFRYSHLASALTFIPYGTIVDAFQHEIYRQPELTPMQRHEVWKRLEADYRPWLDLKEIPFYQDGRGWQAKQHIFQAPFYYIDYCLAQTVALQFWALIRENRDAAWNRYLSLVKMAGTRTFTELLAISGLKTPFDETCLQQIAQTAQQFLQDFPTEKLR